jgi:uncharacterized membrane protein
MSEPSTTLGDDRERRLRLAAVVVSVLALLYGVLIAGQILAPIALVALLFVVYLLWRFVRAHERLAGAVERIAADRADTVGAERRRGDDEWSEPTDRSDSAEQ